MSDSQVIRRPVSRAPDALPERRPSQRRSRRQRPGGRAPEALAFTAATVVGLLHGFDDALIHRQPGVGGDHLPAALAATVAAAAGVWAFPRLRPGLRAVLALSFGVLALVNGSLHAIHIAIDAPARSDVTGVLAAAAGIALIGLAIAIPVLHRGERAATASRRWIARLVAVAGVPILLFVAILPTAIGISQTHKYREPVGAAPDGAYQPIAFDTSDGLRLSGWYVPSRNRAAVILVHGGGGDRMGVRAHARLLARHGYGVLLYDSRGRGRSEGSPNALGWGWEKDVAGAMRFLRSRSDVDPRRIGGLGLSTGADVLIEVAAHDKDLRAVVGEGATGRSFADLPPGERLRPEAPFLWTMHAAAQVFSGASPGPPLRELVARVSPTPLLLISAGLFQRERDFNLIYAKAAREPFALWDRRDGNHTAAIREEPREFEERVTRLFDSALLRRD